MDPSGRPTIGMEVEVEAKICSLISDALVDTGLSDEYFRGLGDASSRAVVELFAAVLTAVRLCGMALPIRLGPNMSLRLPFPLGPERAVIQLQRQQSGLVGGIRGCADTEIPVRRYTPDDSAFPELK